MIPFIVGIVAAACMVMPAFSQEKKEEKQISIDLRTDAPAGKRKIKIVRNINGKEEVIEREFTGEMPEDLKTQLKEMGMESNVLVLPKDGEKQRIVIKRDEKDGKKRKKRDEKEQSFEFKFHDGKIPDDVLKKLEEEGIKIDDAQNIVIHRGGKDKKVEVKTFRLDGGKLPEDVLKKLEAEGIKVDGKDAKFIFLHEGDADVKTYNIDGKQVKVCISKICIIKQEAGKEESKTAGKEEREELSIKDLTLYPNPNDGEFNLKFDLAEKGDTQISIHDAQGKSLYEETLKDFAGVFEKKLSLNQKAGTYTLKIAQNGKIYTRQILVK